VKLSRWLHRGPRRRKAHEDAIVWTSPANVQLADLHQYISESSEPAADHQVAILLNATNNLSDFPEMGRPGRRRGTANLSFLERRMLRRIESATM